jgi:hypothetical protein
MDQPPLDHEHDSNPGPQPLTAGLALLLLFWAAALFFITLILYGSGWLWEQFEVISGREASPVLGIVLTLLHAGAVIVPAWLGRRLIRQPTARAVVETWLLAGVLVLCCLPIRLAPVTAGTAVVLLQIGALALFLLAARFLFRPTERLSPVPPYWPAVVAAASISLWWVLWGAAGSWLDTLLNFIAAGLLGLAAAGLLQRRLLPALESEAMTPRTRILFGGGVAATAALAIIGGALGASGQQLMLIVLLAALGMPAIAVAMWGRGGQLTRGWGAIALLVALVAAGPMLFVDPEELALILNVGGQDVGYWALRATLLAAATAALLGFIAVAFADRLPDWRMRRAGPMAAVASLGLLAGVLLWTGQPGFHGERLFVIMVEQATWDEMPPPDDYWGHRAAVYEQLVGQADRTQKPIREMLDRLDVDYTPYYLVNALEVDGGPLLRWWLASQSEVDRVLASPRLRPLPEPPPITTDTADPPAEPAWNLTSIGAPAVWQSYGVTGEGVIIGQADSGAELSHPELSPTYRGNAAGGPSGHDYNWFDPWTGSTAPLDIGGHGTHTLGSIVGQSVGVAPGATWIACVNLERNLGNPALYLDCMQFLFAPFPLNGDPLRDGRPELGAHVLNNSWGCPVIEGCDPDALLAAVQALRASGVFVVASAGNEGSVCATVQSPIALYDEVFSVGAVDRAGGLASFSSRGPVTADGSNRTKPDIVAPGVEVLSSFPGGTYSISSGTSMAGPHVAGVVALLWSAAPDLIGDIDATEQLIAGTADPYDIAQFGVPGCGEPGLVPDNATGYGLVNAFAAVSAARAAR